MFDDIKERVTARLNQKEYSPYKLSRIESEMREKIVPPQKLYNYVAKGYIEATKNAKGISILQEDAIKYLTATLIKDQLKKIV